MLLNSTSRHLMQMTGIPFYHKISYHCWPCCQTGMKISPSLNSRAINNRSTAHKWFYGRNYQSHLLCNGTTFDVDWNQRNAVRKVHQSQLLMTDSKSGLNENVRDSEMRENIVTIPNILTASRIILAPILGYLVVQESFTWAAGLFVFAGLTDLADGQIARAYPCQRSAFGTALDPLADKILVTVLMVTLTAVNLLPFPLALLIVGRDILLVAGVCFIRYKTLPYPKTIRRYFDVKLPTAELQPSFISKVNTAIQLSLVTATIAAPVFDYIDHPYLQGLWYLTAATTLSSGIGYLYSYTVLNKHVKILKSKLSGKS